MSVSGFAVSTPASQHTGIFAFFLVTQLPKAGPGTVRLFDRNARCPRPGS